MLILELVLLAADVALIVGSLVDMVGHVPELDVIVMAEVVVVVVAAAVVVG